LCDPANSVICFSRSLCCRSNGHKKKKKPQHATVPEGDDEDDDTDALSTTTSELPDDEKYVAKALGKAMGESETDDDPDIAAIRERLLRSELLQSAGDIKGLDQSVDGDIEHGHKHDSEGQGRNWSGYSIGGSEKASSEKGSPESHQRSAQTTEATGLLTSPDDGGSSFLEALLPTIFIAEIEKQKHTTESIGTSDQASTVENHDDEVVESDRPPTPEKIPLFAPSDGGSSFVESLRPSIFTTIASMAEQEEINTSMADQEENREDETGVASMAEDVDNKEDEVDRAGVASVAKDEENEEDEADRAGVASMSEDENKEDEANQAGVTSMTEDEENKEDEANRPDVASIAEDEENKEGEGDHADDQDSVDENEWSMGGQAGGKNHAY
jgi:hypothetical protein